LRIRLYQGDGDARDDLARGIGYDAVHFGDGHGLGMQPGSREKKTDKS
jgi:hypothetical protein